MGAEKQRTTDWRASRVSGGRKRPVDCGFLPPLTWEARETRLAKCFDVSGARTHGENEFTSLLARVTRAAKVAGVMEELTK
jgi:hypothetical protein